MPAQVRWRKRKRNQSRWRTMPSPRAIRSHLVGPGRGGSSPPVHWSTTCNAMQNCRSAEVTKLATAVGVGHRQHLARPLYSDSIVFLRPSCAAPALHSAGLAVAVSVAAKAGRRRQSRQLAEPHQTRALFFHADAGKLARSLVLVRRWMVQFPWVRHGGENGGGIVVVWSGLSNCTGLKVHA